METKQFSEQRKERARQILETSKPEIINENTFLVQSQNSDRKYKVTYGDTFSCECLDFQERCKGHGRYCNFLNI